MGGKLHNDYEDSYWLGYEVGLNEGYQKALLDLERKYKKHIDNMMDAILKENG